MLPQYMELSWKHIAVPRNKQFHDPGLEHALGRNWVGSLGVNLSKGKKKIKDRLRLPN